jgi:lysophospholipase L1-like esterase
MKTTVVLTASLCLMLALAANAAESARKPAAKKAAPAAKRVDPAMVPVTDEPGLPRILLIGDSISIGYTPPVREMLKGKANVHRILTNGGPTTNGAANLDKWLGDGKWDVIHFNFGLHDLKIMETGKHQVSIEDYEANLRKIVARLKETKAKLIWAATTPVAPDTLNPPRNVDDVVKYNLVAEKVVKEAGIQIDDLYACALPRLQEIQLPKNVHFTAAGYRVLAEQVVKSIEQAMAK